MTELVHAVALAVALDADGPLAGALLIGPSGAGKSALALHLIETCPHRRTALVSDDAVLLDAASVRLRASAPQRIVGLVEVRGFGVAAVRTAPAVDLLAGFELSADAPRVPAPLHKALAGSHLPVWPLVARDPATAAIRLRVILRAILARNGAAED
ncbi:MAG: hypothetical protein HXY23_05790 [Parvularculaceae bacterium]|jgi:acetolactate synthase regulatory subunit|nr:hypothetical protein [Parvularculaceae bacterium]